MTELTSPASTNQTMKYKREETVQPTDTPSPTDTSSPDMSSPSLQINDDTSTCGSYTDPDIHSIVPLECDEGFSCMQADFSTATFVYCDYDNNVSPVTTQYVYGDNDCDHDSPFCCGDLNPMPLALTDPSESTTFWTCWDASYSTTLEVSAFDIASETSVEQQGPSTEGPESTVTTSSSSSSQMAMTSAAPTANFTSPTNPTPSTSSAAAALQSTNSTPQSNTGTAVGASIGSVLGVAALLAGGVFLLRRRHKKRTFPSLSLSPFPAPNPAPTTDTFPATTKNPTPSQEINHEPESERKGKGGEEEVGEVLPRYKAYPGSGLGSGSWDELKGWSRGVGGGAAEMAGGSVKKGEERPTGEMAG